jgi:hypothetical protein
MAKRKSTTKKTKKIGKAKSALPLRKTPTMTVFDIPRMDVGNYVAWGNLIKSWSRDPTTAPWADGRTTVLPNGDLQKLKDQCAAAGVGLTVPPYVTKVLVIEQDEDTFVLRLPPAKKIKESEDVLGRGGLYPIPQFYNDAYSKSLNIPNVTLGVEPLQAKLDFHAQRIGDYIIRLTA